MVSPSIFIAMGVTFFLMLLPLPTIFVLLWRKKAFPLNSFFTGTAVFIVFYLVIRYYIRAALPAASPVGLLLAALAVEGGRLTGFLILPRKEETGSLKTGISLALGYMAAAFLLINAFEMFMNFIYAGALQGWGMLADYLNRFPAESVDRVQMLILQTPAYTYFLELISLYLAVPVQLFLTLLVFQFYRNGSGKGWAFLGGAVLLDFFYFGAGSAAASIGWLGHILFLLIVGGASLWGILHFWKEELDDTFGAA
ncbi:MAG: YhfC family glutamic-type intramembrane protease [Spirochaetales bacterium]|nr:YhfC family glutamic-type intramembrane protease [Spirochaetales bacterium]